MPAETARNLVQHDFLRSRGDDRSLAEVARRQHGVVGRVQLLDAGWSEEEIDRRIRAERLTWNQLDDEPRAVSADQRVLLEIER